MSAITETIHLREKILEHPTVLQMSKEKRDKLTRMTRVMSIERLRRLLRKINCGKL